MPAYFRRVAISAFALLMSLYDGNAQEALPPGFVFLRSVDPSIVQDIRYAGSDNFMGRPLPGYYAQECILRADAATALQEVQADLARQGLALKVYDCYRPARAVRAMAQWSRDGLPDGKTKRLYPRLEKRSLFALGYLAERSRHPTGFAVDLTLIEKSNRPVPPFTPGDAYGPCNGPVAQRAPDNSLDMGTSYDCLDPNSHTSSSSITPEQRAARRLLVDVMRKYGFKNYFREWWHFEYGDGNTQQFDFPIR